MQAWQQQDLWESVSGALPPGTSNQASCLAGDILVKLRLLR